MTFWHMVGAVLTGLGIYTAIVAVVEYFSYGQRREEE